MPSSIACAKPAGIATWSAITRKPIARIVAPWPIPQDTPIHDAVHTLRCRATIVETAIT